MHQPSYTLCGHAPPPSPPPSPKRGASYTSVQPILARETGLKTLLFHNQLHDQPRISGLTCCSSTAAAAAGTQDTSQGQPVHEKETHSGMLTHCLLSHTVTCHTLSPFASDLSRDQNKQHATPPAAAASSTHTRARTLLRTTVDPHRE